MFQKPGIRPPMRRLFSCGPPSLRSPHYALRASFRSSPLSPLMYGAAVPGMGAPARQFKQTPGSRNRGVYIAKPATRGRAHCLMMYA